MSNLFACCQMDVKYLTVKVRSAGTSLFFVVNMELPQADIIGSVHATPGSFRISIQSLAVMLRLNPKARRLLQNLILHRRHAVNVNGAAVNVQWSHACLFLPMSRMKQLHTS